MIQEISSFIIGENFKFAGKSAGIYGKKVFTVVEIENGWLKASAVDYKGKPENVNYHFCQTNFNYYDSDLIRIEEK